MDADHTAEAVYNLRGDVNGDCVVNALDMLIVRNAFLEDPDTDDNWKADANQDGQIDIMDMLVVREEIKSECE